METGRAFQSWSPRGQSCDEDFSRTNLFVLSSHRHDPLTLSLLLLLLLLLLEKTLQTATNNNAGGLFSKQITIYMVAVEQLTNINQQPEGLNCS